MRQADLIGFVSRRVLTILIAGINLDLAATSSAKLPVVATAATVVVVDVAAPASLLDKNERCVAPSRKMRNQKCLGIINNCFIPCQSCRLNGTDTKALGRLHRCHTGVQADGEGEGEGEREAQPESVFVATAFVSFCWHLIKMLAICAPYAVRGSCILSGDS